MTRGKVAFVTGITGQDGSYLAELLLSKGYVVHGLVRRSSTFNRGRIDHINPEPDDPNRRVFLHYGDLTDSSMLARLLADIQPDEIYNLGAQSHVGISFDMPEYTLDVTGVGPLRLFESIREARIRPRIYQASSSEMYGDAGAPQNEETRFEPNSPYAAAKVCAHQLAKLYRDSYGLFVTCGILFNHESPRRGENFVTRKITKQVAKIVAGKAKELRLGDLTPRRDWGYAPEYVEAMWMMLQADAPNDYVIATGEAWSVQEFCAEAFKLVGLDWKNHVVQDQQYFRPKDVPELIGDATRARELLGWTPATRTRQLVQIMLQADLAAEDLDPAQHIADAPVIERPEWAQKP